jgi:hypothetical protein
MVAIKYQTKSIPMPQTMLAVYVQTEWALKAITVTLRPTQERLVRGSGKRINDPAIVFIGQLLTKASAPTIQRVAGSQSIFIALAKCWPHTFTAVAY